MLKIGFASKFYTLWDVSTEDVYGQFNGQPYLSHTKVNNFYHQNLSTDLEKAMDKAKSMGCTDLVVDESLRGKHSSFSSTIEHPKPEYDAHQFKFGKFESEDIRLCEDVGYLRWYYSETQCSVAASRWVELDATMHLVDGKPLSKTSLVRDDILGGKHLLTAVSNFSVESDGVESSVFVKIGFEPQTELEQAYLDRNPWGIKIEVSDEGLDLVRREYQGNEYYVPKGKRSFKGTEFNLIDGKIVVKQ